MEKFNINPEKNYVRRDTGHVFTGKQILNFLEIANSGMQAIILSGIEETTEPAKNPNSKYGI